MSERARTAASAALLGCVLGALAVAAAWLAPPAVDAGRAGTGAAAVRTEAGAYRLRQCELALLAGESARFDALLAWPLGAEVPPGRLAPAAAAFLLPRLVPALREDVARGELPGGAFDEDALADGARRLGRALGVLAALALALAAWTCLPPAARTAPAAPGLALLAALALAWSVLALAPAADGGAVRAEPWGLALGALVLACSGGLARARELADQLGLAIAAGVLAGLCFANDPGALPVLAAPFCALLLAARGGDAAPWRNAVRCGVLCAAAALIVVLEGARETTLPRLVFEPLARARAATAPDFALDGALALALVALVPGLRARRELRMLAAVLLAACALRLVDPRCAAAPLAPAGVALLVRATELWRAAGSALARPAVVLLACAAAAAGFALEPRALAAESVALLRGLRSSLPPSGAWSHALARQDWALLASPASAGTVVFHARRAVTGAALPGALPDLAARDSASALLAGTTAELAARMQALGARYVVVARRDVEELDALARLAGLAAGRGPPAGAGGALRLLLSAPDPVEGFELVARAPGELAVWRSTLAPAPVPATLRAR